MPVAENACVLVASEPTRRATDKIDLALAWLEEVDTVYDPRLVVTRQELQPRLRRRRPRQRRVVVDPVDLPQRRPDLPVGQPGARAAAALRRVPDPVRGRRRGDALRRPARPGDRGRAARQPGALREGQGLRRHRRAGRRPDPHRRHRRGLVDQADGAGRHAGRQPAPVRGDLRPGGDRGAFRHRGRGGRAGQRHAVRPRRTAVHRGPPPGPPRLRAAPGRHGVGQLLLHPRPAGALRRRRALRGGPGGRHLQP